MKEINELIQKALKNNNVIYFSDVLSLNLSNDEYEYLIKKSNLEE